MDLESECSALESVEDNELNTGTIPCDDDNKFTTNDSSVNIGIDRLGSGGNVFDSPNTLPADARGKSVESGQAESSPPSTAKSPGGGSPPTTKGFGLKKWRRVRRDFTKDVSPNIDTSKVLKRGFSTPANQNKPQISSLQTKKSSQGSVGHANMLRNMGATDGLAFHGSSLDSRFAVGSAFSAGADSENSEDMSSKSSTAASAPNMRPELPAVLGAYVREKNRMKNVSRKSSGSSTQRGQQGKGPIEGSKKHRGENIKIEKENSHSSLESDSRSSNIFIQGAFSATSNGKQSGRSVNYDGENSDEAHATAEQLSEEAETLYRKENESEDFDSVAANLSWSAKKEKYRKQHSSSDRDPLLESILSLQSVQQALTTEVQKLGEIGNEALLFDSQINGNSELSSLLEGQVSSLTVKIKLLESKLEKTSDVLKAKESRVAQLEAALNINKSPKEKSRTPHLKEEKIKESESYIESLFREKIEAEIEYLAIRKTIDKLKGGTYDQATLFEEQVEMVNKLGEAESKAAMLKKQAKELEKYCDDKLANKEFLKMRRRVCNVCSCLFMQLILLVLVFLLFVSQFSPRSGVAVPT